MASPAVEKMLAEMQQLSDAELEELAELLETERKVRETPSPTQDPLLAIIGGWADMGDATIDAFDAEIQRSRQQPGREVSLGE
jgi:hypothetical protein